MRRVTRLLSGLLFALLTANSSAAIWICSLTDDIVHLICVSEPDLLDPVAVRETTAVVRGVRFPLDPERTFLINLWTPPNDVERLEQLAQASICYRSRDCLVITMVDDLYLQTGHHRVVIPPRFARVN